MYGYGEEGRTAPSLTGYPEPHHAYTAPVVEHSTYQAYPDAEATYMHHEGFAPHHEGYALPHEGFAPHHEGYYGVQEHYYQ